MLELELLLPLLLPPPQVSFKERLQEQFQFQHQEGSEGATVFWGGLIVHDLPAIDIGPQLLIFFRGHFKKGAHDVSNRDDAGHLAAVHDGDVPDAMRAHALHDFLERFIGTCGDETLCGGHKVLDENVRGLKRPVSCDPEDVALGDDARKVSRAVDDEQGADPVLIQLGDAFIQGLIRADLKDLATLVFENAADKHDSSGKIVQGLSFEPFVLW